MRAAARLPMEQAWHRSQFVTSEWYSMTPKKPRVSLTKTQLQAAVGAELLALCQSVTADGVLTNEEVGELRAWLEANRTQDLPAIEFLVATLERILADGKVTREERTELYSAIEKVLPPEARRAAVANRKEVEAEAKAAERREREEEKAQERAERVRRRPAYSMNFMVAGVPYEGRDAVVRKFVAEGDVVYLVRDPNNKYSRNAVEVRIENGMQIGFVPEDYAPEVAPLLDAGHPHKAEVKKIIGYRYSIPVVQAYLYPTDSDEPGIVFNSDVPAKRAGSLPATAPPATDNAFDDIPERAYQPAKSKGCLVLLSVACAPAAIVALRAIGSLG